MKIISTIDLSRPGNDCYIEEEISLVEQFDIYSIIMFQKVSGWCSDDSIEVLHKATDEEEAKKAYERLGGILKKECTY
jgi:hypothetical protein